jgi:hypothetical protein
MQLQHNVDLIFNMLDKQEEILDEIIYLFGELENEHLRITKKKWFEDSFFDCQLHETIVDYNSASWDFNQDCLWNYEQSKIIEYVSSNLLELAFRFENDEKESDIDVLKTILQRLVNITKEHNEQIKELLKRYGE